MNQIFISLLLCSFLALANCSICVVCSLPISTEESSFDWHHSENCRTKAHPMCAFFAIYLWKGDRVKDRDPSMCPNCSFNGEKEVFVQRSLSLIQDPSVVSFALDFFAFDGDEEIAASIQHYIPPFKEAIMKFYPQIARNFFLNLLFLVSDEGEKLKILKKFPRAAIKLILDKLERCQVTQADEHISLLIIHKWAQLGLREMDQQLFLNRVICWYLQRENLESAQKLFSAYANPEKFDFSQILSTKTDLQDSWNVKSDPNSGLSHAKIEEKNRILKLNSMKLSNEFIGELAKITKESLKISLLLRTDLLEIRMRHFKDIMNDVKCQFCIAFWIISMMHHFIAFRNHIYFSIAFQLVKLPTLRDVVIIYAQQKKNGFLGLPNLQVESTDFNYDLSLDLKKSIELIPSLQSKDWKLYSTYLAVLIHSSSLEEHEIHHLYHDNAMIWIKNHHFYRYLLDIYLVYFKADYFAEFFKKMI